MLFLLLAWALASLFHCIPVLKLYKCPFTAWACSIPLSSKDSHSWWDFSLQEQGNCCLFVVFFNSFLIFFDSFQHELQDISVWKYFVFLPVTEGGCRQPVVMQHFHAILLSVFQVGRQCKCLQSGSLIRDSAPCRLSSSMGLVPLLAVWDAITLKSSVYWTATHQLKNLLETEFCQRCVSGICRKSIFYISYEKHWLDSKICFCMRTLPYFTQGSVFPRVHVTS